MPRLSSKARRIKQAKELEVNETLLAIFAALEGEIIERWKGSDTTAKREACYYEIRALEGLRDAIYATATDTE